MTAKVETALRGPQAYDLARRVIEGMEAASVWPSPLNFELWTHYLADPESALGKEIARLDGMLEKLWPKARRGEVSAVDRVLKIGERRAKLLGIEAPVRIETTGKDGKPIEVSSTATIDPSKLSTQTLQDLLDARLAPDGR